MRTRIERARSFFKGLDAILFTDRNNIRYLSGFSGSEAALVVTGADCVIFVDSRYTLQAGQQTADTRVVEVSDRWDAVGEFLAEAGIRMMGVESNIMDLDTYLKLKEKFKTTELTPLGEQLKSLRIIKDGSETEILKTAARISEEALEAVLSKGLVGRREDEVAFDLECEMRRRGASGVSFELIVASGQRSAMPHGIASERVIRAGEPVVIDFGCIYEGYCSDQTVTLFTGTPDADFAEAYRRVFDAQQLAIAALKPGVRTDEIDRIARGHLEDHGLARYFGHGLGHGVGLDVHEMPNVSPRTRLELEAGMVVTIEPGVYLTDRFGIRLEDTLLITDNSCQRITNIDKDSVPIIN